MIKIITFHGRVNMYKHDDMAGDCADDKFNRWMIDHQSVSIKDIHIEMTQEVYQVITVVYEEPDDFVEHPSIFEDGKYYVDLDCGKMINCKSGADVSYMVKDFDAIKCAFLPHWKSPAVLSMYCGSLHYIYKFTQTESNDPRYGGYGMGCKESSNTLSICADVVVHAKYLPAYRISVQCDTFRIHEHPGKYILKQNGINDWKLIKVDNNLDLSHILNQYAFSLSATLSSDSPIECDGKNFIIAAERRECREIACVDIIKSNYL